MEGCQKTGDADMSRLCMDNANILFTSKMVYSSHKHIKISDNQVCWAKIVMKETCEKSV